MKFNYKFSNLLGTVYHQGDIIFSSNGDTVICPVGNKISLYDLKNNVSRTLPIEARHNYASLCLSPNGRLLIASVEDGELHIINLNQRNVLYRRKFKRPVQCIKFSPNGCYFAVAMENKVFVYCVPNANRRVFDPFVLKKVYSSAMANITCIDWSDDSRLIAFGSKDMSVHVSSFTRFDNFRDCPVAGNTDEIVSVSFLSNSIDFCSVNKQGHVQIWESTINKEELIPSKNIYEKLSKESDDDEDDDDYIGNSDAETEAGPPAKKKKFLKENPAQIDKRKYLHYRRKLRIYLDEHLGKNKRSPVTTVSYDKKNCILLVAFASGDFLLMDLNDKGALIHSLNVSNQMINSCSFNSTGDWLAIGIASLGQLVVWEWQSESFVLKQQGHFNNVKVVAYSPDGLNLATGGEDGKVKLWSTQSGFSYVTFTEHVGPVTGVVFTQSGKAVLSSSLDGTVRAFDRGRYRNFKTLTSPRPAQFSCLAVDGSGELVAAGCQDHHEIFLWSLQTGRLLEILSGHAGPVSSLQFSPQPGSTMLVSTAWDKSVKVWDAIATTTAKESIFLVSDGLSVALRPDGKQFAVATLDGKITFFDPFTTQQQGVVEGRNDLGAGRADADKITAKSNLKSKAFTTLCYSSDGLFVLAGGQSKNVCIYNVESELLVKKFQVTQNRSFDAMDEVINRRKLAENGVNLALVEERGDADSSVKVKLPGTRSGDMSLRDFRPEVRVSSLIFSPTGRSWAACTSEGLLVYSLDDEWLFDPLLLDESNTPAATKKKLKAKEYSTALMMACQLNIKILIQEVLENIPLDAISVIVSSLPLLYVESVLKYLGEFLEKSRHVGLYTRWVSALSTQHGQVLKLRAPHILSVLNQLQKSLSAHHDNLGKVCSHNEYTLSFLLSQASLKRKGAPPPEEVSHPAAAEDDSSDDQMSFLYDSSGEET